MAPDPSDVKDVATAHEAIAALCHSIMFSLHFEGQGITKYKSHHDIPDVSSSGKGSVTYLYKHAQSPLQFAVNVERANDDKVEVRGVVLDDNTKWSFSQTVSNVIIPSGLPVQLNSLENNIKDQSQFSDKLNSIFVSELAMAGMLYPYYIIMLFRLTHFPSRYPRRLQA
ncbi:hypothetical protein G7046_g10181 [Stylonectria norvegica]|nr:hypothetical protein G7046_g10181 [Stylonectria norvegica]